MCRRGREEALLDGSIDPAVGNNRKKDIVEILEAFAKREKAGRREPAAMWGGEDAFPAFCSGYQPGGRHMRR